MLLLYIKYAYVNFLLLIKYLFFINSPFEVNQYIKYPYRTLTPEPDMQKMHHHGMNPSVQKSNLSHSMNRNVPDKRQIKRARVN